MLEKELKLVDLLLEFDFWNDGTWFVLHLCFLLIYIVQAQGFIHSFKLLSVNDARRCVKVVVRRKVGLEQRMCFDVVEIHSFWRLKLKNPWKKILHLRSAIFVQFSCCLLYISLEGERQFWFNCHDFLFWQRVYPNLLYYWKGILH